MNPEKLRTLEESVIACCIMKSSFADVDLLPNEFRLENTSELFRAGLELESRGQAIDIVTLSAATGKKITVSEVSRIAGDLIPTSRNLPHYIQELKKDIYETKARALKKKASEEIKEAADPEPIARALTSELDFLAARYLPAQENNRLQEICCDMLTKIEAGEPVKGFFKSGITTIDKILEGLCPPEYTVIAARPSIGKTALTINLLASLADQGIKSSFFSLEMGGNPVAARLLSYVSQVNTKLVLRAPDRIKPEDKELMLQNSAKLLQLVEKISLHDEPGQSIKTIAQVARKEVKEKGSKILIVDHIQHCRGFGKDRKSEVENISQTFQDLLKELNVPGIMLSQISRKLEAENRRPVLSDLKESGAIEQNADNVIFLHKPGNQNRSGGYTLEFILAKGRNIGSGFGTMFFNTEKQTFTEVYS